MNNSNTSDRILVGVDGSDSSVSALRAGARIAAAFNAPLEAIMTWQIPAMVEVFPVPEWSPERDAHDVLSAAVEEAFEGTPPPNLTLTTMEGSPAGVLISESETAQMLVVGSRGRGGFTGLLLGSVSSTCAEHARCPVLVVHDYEGEK